MPAARPFRFATGGAMTASTAAYAKRARQAEALGYSTFLVADHFSPKWFEPGPALTAAALATTSLRVGCTVFCNDFRHPALLAREAAAIDVLTDGRLEFGIGAGWVKQEYDQIGLPFDAPGVRVSRMEEAVRVIKGLWGEGEFTFAGTHYTITGLDGMPKPLQRPHPPLFIGGGGRRLLTFAAREADNVGILAQALPGGGLDLAGDSEAVLARKVDWVREAAGARFDRLELAALIWAVAVADRRREAAERLAGAYGLTAEAVLASPYFLIGSIDQIVEDLIAQRERHGISYITVLPQDMEAFAPAVARLVGR